MNTPIVDPTPDSLVGKGVNHARRGDLTHLPPIPRPTKRPINKQVGPSPRFYDTVVGAGLQNLGVSALGRCALVGPIGLSAPGYKTH